MMMNATIGIDLGTTRSLIASVDSTGNPRVLPNSEGETVTPTVAYFGWDQPLVGRDAVSASVNDPAAMVRDAKRHLGDASFGVEHHNHRYSAEDILGLVLAKLAGDAAEALGTPIESAVVTIPAFFNQPRRQATLRAARAAGLPRVTLLSEPTAAAIHHAATAGWIGDQHAEHAGHSKTLMVYDLGGGTFDVSLVQITPGNVRVLAVEGNARLGGIDWDEAIARWMITEAGLDPTDPDLSATLGRLLPQAEAIKWSLSVGESVRVRVDVDGWPCDAMLHRDQFESMTAHLMDRTRFTIDRLLASSAVPPEQIDTLLLVGGSTRMPQIANTLRRRYDIAIESSKTPETLVALGAARYARWLRLDPSASVLTEEVDYEGEAEFKAETSPPPGGTVPNPTRTAATSSNSRPQIIDVSVHDLGVLGTEPGTGRPLRHRMIQRFTPLPAVRRSRFQTARHGQRSVRVPVVEGGDDRGGGSTSLGTLTIAGLPENLPGQTPVVVQFKYDRSGLLDVQAWLPGLGRQAGLSIHMTPPVEDHADPSVANPTTASHSDDPLAEFL